VWIVVYYSYCDLALNMSYMWWCGWCWWIIIIENIINMLLLLLLLLVCSPKRAAYSRRFWYLVRQ